MAAKRRSKTTFFDSAIEEFWADKDVRAGKRCDGFIRSMAELILDEGLAGEEELLQSGKAIVPGFFRATKNWDLVIIKDGSLLAAIELKSQVGPSFGNNFNNRSEEAIGSAIDIRTAFDNGLLGNGSPPWLGYMFVLEEADKTSSQGTRRKTPIPKDDVFESGSYTYFDRYRILLDRLGSEGHYDRCSLIMTRRPSSKMTGKKLEPPEHLSATSFVQSLLDHLSRQ